MSVLITGSSHQQTPQNDGGGAFFVGVAVLGGIAYFWSSIAWFFGVLYSYVAGFVGWFGSAGGAIAEDLWSLGQSLLSGALDLIGGAWAMLKFAVAGVWSAVAVLVLALWSVAVSLFVLVWTLATTTFAMDGGFAGLGWEYFGIYLLFGLATGIVVGVVKSWLKHDSRTVEEVAKAVGSPKVITATRVGAMSVAYEVAISLALSVLLAVIGLVVPYLLGGMATPIAPGGALEFALYVTGGAGGSGGGGFGAGGGGGEPALLVLICALILLFAIVVGALVGGMVSIFAGGLAAGAASALGAGAEIAGHSIGHAAGKNLIVALTRTKAQRKDLAAGDLGQTPAHWRFRMIGAGVRIGAILGIIFSMWLVVSLLLEGGI